MHLLRRLSLGLLAFSLGTSAVVPIHAQTHTATPAKPAQAGSQKAASSSNLLDINTATPDQLKALPGIGDAYTKRIIDGRPYTAKNQLTMRGVIPQATYDKIKDQIVAHRATASTAKPSGTAK